MRKFLILLLLFPLSACFDADLRLTVESSDDATMVSRIDMGPELYGMIASSGQDACPDGVGTANGDGSFTCVRTDRGTIDELIEKARDEEQAAAQHNGIDPTEGVTIERLPGGLVKLVVNLSDIRAAGGEMGVDPMMLASLQQAFQGHGIRMTVAGENVIATNGVMSEDGKEASLYVPLDQLLNPVADLPDTFEAIVAAE